MKPTRPTTEELVAQHDRLAWWCANRCRPTLPPQIDFEDIVQVARIGLWHAAKTYDPVRSAKFGTYATVAIRHRIQRFLNVEMRAGLKEIGDEAARRKGLPHATPCVIHASACEDGGTPLLDRIGKEGIRPETWTADEWASVLGVLTPRQREAIRLIYLEGHSQEEASKRMGCTRTNVWLLHGAAIERLKRERPELAEVV